MTRWQYEWCRKYSWLCYKSTKEGKPRAVDLAHIRESADLIFPDLDRLEIKAEKERNKLSAKRKRAEKHFVRLFEHYDQLYWIRLSFRDDVLESTNEKNRHVYVQRLLKEKCKDYVANIDYGSKNGREHYHALAALKDPSKKFEWPYGFTTCRKVRMASDQAKRTSKDFLKRYLIKFINHASKQGAGKVFAARGMKEIDRLPF